MIRSPSGSVTLHDNRAGVLHGRAAFQRIQQLFFSTLESEVRGIEWRGGIQQFPIVV